MFVINTNNETKQTVFWTQAYQARGFMCTILSVKLCQLDTLPRGTVCLFNLFSVISQVTIQTSIGPLHSSIYLTSGGPDTTNKITKMAI